MKNAIPFLACIIFFSTLTFCADDWQKKYEKELLDAADSGKKAYIAGLSAESNPYQGCFFTKKSEIWFKNYLDAKEQGH